MIARLVRVSISPHTIYANKVSAQTISAQIFLRSLLSANFGAHIH